MAARVKTAGGKRLEHSIKCGRLLHLGLWHKISFWGLWFEGFGLLASSLGCRGLRSRI